MVEAQTRAGRIRGEQRGRSLAFRGIPFAQPPVGDARFAPPEPHEPWSGVRDALEFGCAAPQGMREIGVMATNTPTSEDCLFLNVYTPALDDGRRPVLFFIHGGGFTAGGGSQAMYDGGPLAERGDVVVVTINYRLGALGYLYLGEHGGDDWGAAHNAGQLDQIEALRWTRDNVAAFGGDPDNVTIFGESAGSVAVATLLAMPDARGLFHKAICESGTANRLATPRHAAPMTAAVLRELGLERADADALRGASLEAMMEAQRKGSPARRGYAPVIDGTTLPERPLSFVRAGGAAEIPLMVGTNRDEQKLYINPKRAPIDDAEAAARIAQVLPGQSREAAAELMATYRESRVAAGLPHSNNDLVDAAMTDSSFRIPSTRLAEAQSTHTANTFMYLFCWGSPGWRGTMGACHGLELPFVFGTTDLPGVDRWVGHGQDALRLSGLMMDAWIAFARSGDPSHAALGPWAPYDAARRATMVFDATTTLTDAPFEQEREHWARLLSR